MVGDIIADTPKNYLYGYNLCFEMPLVYSHLIFKNIIGFFGSRKQVSLNLFITKMTWGKTNL